MSEERGMIAVGVILKTPEIIDEIKDKYQIICDWSMVKGKFDGLNKAINVMARKGWRCLSITSFGMSGGLLGTDSHMFALMERIES